MYYLPITFKLWNADSLTDLKLKKINWTQKGQKDKRNLSSWPWLKADALLDSLRNEEIYENGYLCLWYEAWKWLWLETDSGYLKWLGMWLHGAAPNLRWGGQTPWGLNCGSWYVSKNRQPPTRPRCSPLPPPPPPPLFFIADADLCLSSKGSNYWVRGKDAPPFNKTTSKSPDDWQPRSVTHMSDGNGEWKGSTMTKGKLN